MNPTREGRAWHGLTVGVPVAEALDQFRSPPGTTTGLACLDELTGGPRPGDVWAIRGPSGSGVSMLGLQIAVAVSLRSGTSAAVVCNHLPIAVQCGRVLAQTSRVRLSHLWPDNALERNELRRVDEARRRLATAPLHLATGLCGVAEDADAAVRLVAGGTAPSLLVVDGAAQEFRDATGRPEEVDRLIRLLAGASRTSGTALILCDRLLPTPAPELSATFHDIADVLLEISASAAPSPCLRVRKNRWGPQAHLPDLTGQFHFARFAPVSPGESA